MEWNQVKTINGGEPIKYKKSVTKIRFEWDDYLPLGKILSIPNVIIVTRSVFQEDSKYYPRVFMKELMFQKEQIN